MEDLTGRKAIQLKPKDKKEIDKLLRSKSLRLRVYKRARVLHLVSSGHTQAKAALLSGVSVSTSARTCLKYKKEGLEEALYDQARSGRPDKLTTSQKQRVVALICSCPPKGFPRWTIRLVAKELRRRKITPKISRNTVWLLMQSHKLKPWREKNVVYRRNDKGI